MRNSFPHSCRMLSSGDTRTTVLYTHVVAEKNPGGIDWIDMEVLSKSCQFPHDASTLCSHIGRRQWCFGCGWTIEQFSGCISMFYRSRRRQGYPHVNFFIWIDSDQIEPCQEVLADIIACPAIDGTTSQERGLLYTSFNTGNWLRGDSRDG